MKKIILIAICLCTMTLSKAQSFRAGLEGAFNSTWLFNKTVSDAGDNLDYKSTFGGQYGVTAIYNFKEGVGISTGVLFGSVNQKYTNRNFIGSKQIGDAYETEAKLKYIDIPLLFRITSKSGPYFEVGPQFSLLSKSEFTARTSSTSASVTSDIKDQTSNLNISGQIGFGYDIKASDQIIVNAGLRFGYGFTDALKSDYKVNGKHESTNTAVGGFHVGVTYLISNKDK